jgi:hypothetical protein
MEEEMDVITKIALENEMMGERRQVMKNTLTSSFLFISFVFPSSFFPFHSFLLSSPPSVSANFFYFSWMSYN